MSWLGHQLKVHASGLPPHSTFAHDTLRVDLEPLTAQFNAQGIVFQNAIAFKTLTAFGTLNELDFPPKSGVTVVSDSGGPINGQFASHHS